MNFKCTSCSAGGNNGTREPKGVVHGTNDTAVSGVVDLNDVHGTGRGSNRNTETEKETAAHELAGAVGSGLNAGSDNDDAGSDEHTDAATPGVKGRADEGKSDDTTDLIDGRDDTGPDTVVLGSIALLEGGVLQQVVDERTVVSVHGGTEETNEREGVDQDLSLGPGTGRLLDHGLVEGLGAGDHLGLDFLL